MQQGPLAGLGRPVQDLPVRLDDLDHAFLRLGEAPGLEPARPGAAALHEGGHVVGARAQAFVERRVEVRGEAEVYEDPGGGQHRDHHEREDEGEPDRDGQPAHRPRACSSRAVAMTRLCRWASAAAPVPDRLSRARAAAPRCPPRPPRLREAARAGRAPPRPRRCPRAARGRTRARRPDRGPG